MVPSYDDDKGSTILDGRRRLHSAPLWHSSTSSFSSIPRSHTWESGLDSWLDPDLASFADGAYTFDPVSRSRAQRQAEEYLRRLPSRSPTPTASYRGLSRRTHEFAPPFCSSLALQQSCATRSEPPDAQLLNDLSAFEVLDDLHSILVPASETVNTMAANVKENLHSRAHSEPDGPVWPLSGSKEPATCQSRARKASIGLVTGPGPDATRIGSKDVQVDQKLATSIVAATEASRKNVPPRMRHPAKDLTETRRGRRAGDGSQAGTSPDAPSSIPSSGTLTPAKFQPVGPSCEGGLDAGGGPDECIVYGEEDAHRYDQLGMAAVQYPTDSKDALLPLAALSTSEESILGSEARLRALQLEMHLNELAARQAAILVQAERGTLQRQRDAVARSSHQGAAALADATSLRAQTNIYVNNLPDSCTDEALHRLGSVCGTVISHKAMIDLDRGTCKGYGFVMYATPEEAQRAIIWFSSHGFQTSYAKESFSAKLRRMADRSSTNVYLSNLPVKFTAQQLEQLFAPHPVVSLRILTDANGESRGVGFVRLRDRELAQICIERLHGKILPGTTQPLQVRFADSEAQKQLKQSVSTKRTIESLGLNKLRGSNGTDSLYGLQRSALFPDQPFGGPDRPMLNASSVQAFAQAQNAVSPILTASPDLSTSSSISSHLSTPSISSYSSSSHHSASDCASGQSFLDSLAQMQLSQAPAKDEAFSLASAHNQLLMQSQHYLQQPQQQHQQHQHRQQRPTAFDRKSIVDARSPGAHAWMAPSNMALAQQMMQGGALGAQLDPGLQLFGQACVGPTMAGYFPDAKTRSASNSVDPRKRLQGVQSSMERSSVTMCGSPNPMLPPIRFALPDQAQDGTVKVARSCAIPIRRPPSDDKVEDNDSRQQQRQQQQQDDGAEAAAAAVPRTGLHVPDERDGDDNAKPGVRDALLVNDRPKVALPTMTSAARNHKEGNPTITAEARGQNSLEAPASLRPVQALHH